MSDGNWHLMVGGQPQGPFSLEELEARAGRDLTPATQVWRAGMAEWTTAGAVPELAGLLRAEPARPPAATPARPRPPATSSARVATEEERTLNPFRLAARAFRWRGRFDRGQFAMVWFGVALLNALLLGMLFLALMLVARGIGGPRAAAGAILVFWGIVAIDLIVALLLNIGALIRRLNDLGRPAWWVVGAFVPLANLALIVYLLVAASDPNARLPESFRGAILALCGLFVGGLLVGVGLFAIIAVPALSRARVTANEVGAQGDLRTVVSAQMAYSYSNSGQYAGRFECLQEPASCIAGYAGPSFIDTSLGEQPKSGYQHRLHTAEGSPQSSTSSFAVVAWPITPGTTGTRSFCIDTSGSLCSARDVAPEALVTRENGEVKCSSACLPS